MLVLFLGFSKYFGILSLILLQSYIQLKILALPFSYDIYLAYLCISGFQPFLVEPNPKDVFQWLEKLCLHICTVELK